MNKNLLLKARVGTDAAVASLAFKAWWQPSFTFALSGGYDLAARKPRVGLVFNCENYGNIRCGGCTVILSISIAKTSTGVLSLHAGKAWP